MSKEEVKEYIEFMCNQENEYMCDACPENRDFDNWQGILPCGQQNCWVKCHCEN